MSCFPYGYIAFCKRITKEKAHTGYDNYGTSDNGGKSAEIYLAQSQASGIFPSENRK